MFRRECQMIESRRTRVVPSVMLFCPVCGGVLSACARASRRDRNHGVPRERA